MTTLAIELESQILWSCRAYVNLFRRDRVNDLRTWYPDWVIIHIPEALSVVPAIPFDPAVNRGPQLRFLARKV